MIGRCSFLTHGKLFLVDLLPPNHGALSVPVNDHVYCLHMYYEFVSCSDEVLLL
jgi:hypothetical protein